MTTSRTPRIFISHSHKDNGFGTQLVQDLCQVIGDESAVWYDSEGGLMGGDLWWPKIAQEIQRRSTFIIIFSPNSLKSPWVKKEMNMALKRHIERKMKVIPILYQPCKIPNDFQDIQAISFLPDRVYEEAFQDLKNALNLSRRLAPIKASSPSSNYRRDREQQLIQEAEMAYRKGDWPGVIEKVQTISRQYPEKLTPSLHRMQGWAYLFENQPSSAQDALGRGIRLMQDPQKQLTLLDEYAAQCVSNGQWNKLLTCADEALRLDPYNSTWHTAKGYALEKVQQIFPERTVLHSPVKENAVEEQIKETNLELGKNTSTVTSAIKQNILVASASANTVSEQEMGEFELQKQTLLLRKEQFHHEKEVITFAFEMAERVAKIQIDEDSSAKVKLLRTFLHQFLSLGDKKES